MDEEKPVFHERMTKSNILAISIGAFLAPKHCKAVQCIAVCVRRHCWWPSEDDWPSGRGQLQPVPTGSRSMREWSLPREWSIITDILPQEVAIITDMCPLPREWRIITDMRPVEIDRMCIRDSPPEDH